MDPRTTLRHPVELEASVAFDGTELPCTVRNLSLGGVFVHGISLALDRKVRLRFLVPKQHELLVTCVVRWSTAEGTGLQFLDLRAVDTHALTVFLRAAARATARTFVADILNARS